MIAANLKAVTQRIARCCEKAGRPANEVTLICVTKEADIDDIKEALAAGATDLGENRVQDAILKHRAIGDRATWHLVGHLQTNKVKDAVRIFSLIHSVDSIPLIEGIDNEAKKINKVQDILIQVNTSDERSKFGIAADKISEFFKELHLYSNIAIQGLMTIAPESENAEDARPYFRMLRQLKDEINGLHIVRHELRLLSMGMSGDFEVAIEEGANMVRIGRAVFKK